MRRTLTSLLIVLAVLTGTAWPASAQTRTRIASSGTLPTDCRTGEIFQKTGSSAGVYFCSATNTWTLIAGSGSGDALTSNPLSQFAPTTSAQFSGVITNETGSGVLVLATSPTLVTPTLGAASATSINGLTITSSTGTLTIANGKTATISNILTFAGTDGSTITLGAGGTVLYASGALGTPSSATLTNATGLPPAGVTFAATDRFLCRDTASGGAGEECTGAAAAGIIGLTNILGLYTGTPNGSQFLRDDGAWTAIAGGGDALVANPLSQFASTTSAQLATVLSNEEGTGGGFVRATGWATLEAANAAVLRTDTTTAHTFKIQGYDVDGTAYTDLLTVTNGNTPTINLAAGTTFGGSALPSFTPAGGAALEILYFDNTSSTVKAPTAFVSNGAGAITLGTAGSVVGQVLFKNATSGTVTLSAVTGALGTVTVSLPAATDTLVGKATSDTLTNKTYDVEATGNVFTDTVKWMFNAGVCQGSTASLGVSGLASLSPTATCVTGTNVTRAWATFPDSDGNYEMQGELLLPTDWTGALDINGVWRASATSGDIKLYVTVACSADAEVFNDTWVAAGNVVETAKGTTLQHNTWSISGLTTTGCAAGELMNWRVYRQRTDAADTLSTAFDLGPITFTARRAK